jgi:6-phosphogluconolactonase
MGCPEILPRMGRRIKLALPGGRSSGPAALSDDGSGMKSLNRRDFLRGAALASTVGRNWWLGAAQAAKRRLLLVGTQTVDGSPSKGIYCYSWDPATGDLQAIGLAAESENPTFLAVDPNARFLYAANEIDSFEAQASGSVSSFAINASTGRLTPINRIRSLGAGTCMVAVDTLGRNLFCANYTGGSATSFYLNSDGQISDPVSHFQYSGHGPDKDRQEGPHAHRVTVSPDDRYLLVNDLGLDCIHIYHLDSRTARLTPNDPPQWNATPGSGPRALRFHPNGRIAYCVHELVSQVEVLHWDTEKGMLRSVQKISLIPDGYHGATRGDDIVVDRAGRFAYAANRDYDCLVSFSVDPKDGRLTETGRGSCGGTTPRHLTLDPTERWLLVANQDTDNISVFPRDPKTGSLGQTAKNIPLAKPQCLVWA